jgi:hypothetical protein
MGSVQQADGGNGSTPGCWLLLCVQRRACWHVLLGAECIALKNALCTAWVWHLPHSVPALAVVILVCMPDQCAASAMIAFACMHVCMRHGLTPPRLFSGIVRLWQWLHLRQLQMLPLHACPPVSQAVAVRRQQQQRPSTQLLIFSLAACCCIAAMLRTHCGIVIYT